MVVLGWYVGRRVRRRGEYLRLLEERAAYLERERHATAQLAADEERSLGPPRLFIDVPVGAITDRP